MHTTQYHPATTYSVAAGYSDIHAIVLCKVDVNWFILIIWCQSEKSQEKKQCGCNELISYGYSPLHPCFYSEMYFIVYTVNTVNRKHISCEFTENNKLSCLFTV